MRLRRYSYLMMAAGLVGAGLLAAPATAETAPTTLYYGDVELMQSESSNLWYPGSWDVTACDLTVTYTVDFSEVISPGGWETSWNSVGVGRMGEGGFGWMSSGYPASDETKPEKLDLDDKHNLGSPDRSGEASYNVLAADPDAVLAPFGTNKSRYIWFDRDGVDPWQDTAAANTGGTYDIQVVYHATDTDPDVGTMIGSVNGLIPDFDTTAGDGLNYDKLDAGKSFTGNGTGDLAALNVWSNAAAPHGPVALRDITATGCLNLETGKGTGGGWFIAEETGGTGSVTPGGKATFGFVAQQSDKHDSTGNLQFQYKTDGLELHSDGYDWVNVANSQVMFEGTGTLNGIDGYRFRVRAVDGDKTGGGADRFEIRIWTGTDSFDSPIHRAEGDLGGGQIMVHKK